MGVELNTMNHRSECSAYWHLQRQKDAKEPPIISGIHHGRGDVDCVLHCYFQGLIAIDCSPLITMACDYLAGQYWFFIDQSSATCTDVSVSSLSFSTLLVQYCCYDTPGFAAAQSLPGGACLLRYRSIGQSAKVSFTRLNQSGRWQLVGGLPALLWWFSLSLHSGVCSTESRM